MDSFAELDAREREPYFREAAARKGLQAHIIEKDFWVCWTLRRLFELDTLKERLLFKGGTSLSKAHKVIERFSEDIDLSIHRGTLGFEGDADPATPEMSAKKRTRQINALATAARKLVNGDVRDELNATIEKHLGHQGWSLSKDETDPDGQSLAFNYPRTSLTQAPAAYLKPSVKIEFGARSDHWPAAEKVVLPYLAEELPDALDDPETKVKTLDATRTFWEKATILHQMAHLPEAKSFPARYSRHYCDLAAMIQDGIGDNASANEALLKAVVDHKKAFYRSAWADYDTAVRGSLRLLPPDDRRRDLAADLESMTEMFFKNPPKLDDVLETLRQWVDKFNRAQI